MVKVTLKDDVVKEFQSGTTVMDIAKSIGMGLYKAACLAKIDGETCDASHSGNKGLSRRNTYL